MNSFVETPTKQRLYSWGEVKANQGIYIWNILADESRSEVALFVSSGHGEAVIFHQIPTLTNGGRQFTVAAEGTWHDSKFIKLSGKLTCEFVS